MSRNSQDLKVDLTEEVADFQELGDELTNLDLKNAFVVDFDSKSNAITEPQALKIEESKQPFFSVQPTTIEAPNNDISQSVEVIECDENINYISEKLSIIPFGIIECQVPHIGTTYLELHADRNSIILFKCFFKTIRPKREYIIQAGDKFNIHKERISKEENNLLKLFIITDNQPNKSSISIVI